MRILGIESSCDDTSVALVQADDTGIVVVSEKTASQIDIHKKYGGVVPEIAGRKHAEKILPVVEAVLEGHDKPDAIAVTAGPGLMTGLLVGTEVAKTLSYLWNIPLIPVNHIDGHIHSVITGSRKQEAGSKIALPAVCLIVSGGHTELILMKDHGKYELLGKTRDDAAGEAFDKVAKLLGFEYPGGPKISKFAETGNPKTINFPRPMLDDDSFDMSFSGLKTAALYWLRDNNLAAVETVNTNGFKLPVGVTGIPNNGPTISDFCASFEQAIVDVLVTKTLRAVKQHKPASIILAGGVSANSKLRTTLASALGDTPLLLPERKYCMDNAAMIATAGYFKAKKNECAPWQELVVNPNWKVYENNN